jgi:uncharacterized membrane protein
MKRLAIIVLAVLLGAVFGDAGIFRSGFGGAFLGLCLGLLYAELLTQRKRLGQLEQRQAESPADPARPGEVDFTPRADDTLAEPASLQPSAASQQKTAAGVADREKESALDRFFAGLGKSTSTALAMVTQFFTGGNLVLRVGVVILFIGVSFLVKYAAQRELVPLEFRLAAAAAGGVVLLGTGWWLRQREGGYGLVLQGGGIGILYLVVFGAGRLYGLLPPLFSLVLMVLLVGLSCLLAVLQNSRSLAFFGTIGGFLAPVLISTGSGSHVVLFTYFALLNSGIVAIAWFKAWRELNLLGFLFTFGIGTIWGSSGYRPEHFVTTEPFLLLFFFFYVAISALFALRQPVNLRGFIDGPLVFGLPLIVSALQYFLVKDFAYGMAFSALGLGSFYLLMATMIWKKAAAQLRLLAETFLALGVIFASLAIPLGLDGHWSGAIWALEGAGMVWVGARQERILARHFGLLLQLAAGLIFLASVYYPLDSRLFANHYYLGCVVLSLSGVISAYLLDRYATKVTPVERYYPLPLLALGTIWWYVGGLREIDRHIPPVEAGNGLILYLSATAILVGFFIDKSGWRRLALVLLLQLPVMIVALLHSLQSGGDNLHLMQGWGLAAWGTAFFVLYRILYLFANHWPARISGWYHAVSLWLLVLVISHESAWLVGQLPSLRPAWVTAAWAVIPVTTVLLVLRLEKTTTWPVGRNPDSYLGPGAGGLAIGMISWVIISFTSPGDPGPLPYLPILNPVELLGLAIFFTLVMRARANLGRWQDWRNRLVSWCPPLVGLLFFGWINCVVARVVHHYAGVHYTISSMFASTLYQAAIAAVWGFGALAITLWATRRRSRAGWIVGAALLGLTVAKLLLVDLSGSGTVARIISFLVVGVLMLIIGYFSPMPPTNKESSS